MNLPNKLTISRIVLAFVFMFFLFSKGIGFKCLALAAFILASITDFYDGQIARKLNQVTDFGKFVDPIADKVLMLAAFLGFVEMNLAPAWMVVIIIARELIVTGLRLLAVAKGKVLAATRSGKHKTVSQIVAIITILIFIIFREAGMRVFGIWTGPVDYLFKQAIFLLMLVTTTLTIISGVSFLRRNKKIF